jgi:hypothetical protein
MSKQSASGLEIPGGSYQVGYGNLLVKFAKQHHLATPHGVLGLSFLHALGKNIKSKKHGAVLNEHAYKHLKSYLKKSIKNPTKKHVLDFIKKHENKPIHVSDMFGSNFHEKGEHVLKALGIHQEGGSFWSKLKKTVKKAGHKMGQFFRGKLKYKPSHLARDIGKVSGEVSKLVALIPDPRAQGVAKALDIGSKIAKPVSSLLEHKGLGKDEKEGGALYTVGQRRGPKNRLLPYNPKYGSKCQVFRGTADMTGNGITKDQLVKNKHGRIVLKSRSESAKRAYAKRVKNGKGFSK